MLRKREKFVVLLGGIAAAFLLLLSFVVIPDAGKARSLSRTFSVAEKDLAELRKMRPELERSDKDVRIRDGRVAAGANATVSSLARLTNAVQDAGFPQTAFSLKSGGVKDGEFLREESFDLKVENMTYLEAAQLITKLENGPLPVVIRSAQFKSRYDDARYLDGAFRLGFLLPLNR